MINCLIDPSIFFIDEDTWHDTNDRDDFILNFLDHSEYIENLDLLILMTEDLNFLMMTHPYSPPWVRDGAFMKSFIPIFTNKFMPKVISINLREHDQALVLPEMSFSNEVIKIEFLKLVHFVLQNYTEIYLCLSEKNSRSSYKFYCGCHVIELFPHLIINPIDWINFLKIEENLWPIDKNDQDTFKKCLEYYMRKESITSVNEFYFDQKFIKDIANELNIGNRVRILKSISKRLSFNLRQAELDGSLRDEFIVTKGEHRFRASGELRIHYIFEDKVLKFINYYGEGEHDDGL